MAQETAVRLVDRKELTQCAWPLGDPKDGPDMLWLNSHWRGGMSAGIISDELDCIVSRSAILGIVRRRRQIEGPDFWPSRRPSRVRKYPEGRKRRFPPRRSPTTSEKPT